MSRKVRKALLWGAVGMLALGFAACYSTHAARQQAPAGAGNSADAGRQDSARGPAVGTGPGAGWSHQMGFRWQNGAASPYDRSIRLFLSTHGNDAAFLPGGDDVVPGSRLTPVPVAGGASAATPSVVPDELWIIAKSEAAAAPDDELPGTGALLATRIRTWPPDGPRSNAEQPGGQPVAPPTGQQQDIPVPLKHTDVQARLSAFVASVTVTQQFANPFNEKIEAKYVFPLPADAAVNEFVMTIGERRIRGIIRERQEAERLYAEARNQGYVAALMTQERPNIFTQSVANIEPGKQIDVQITYFHTLTYDDGCWEFHFPMVVGPRFNPPGSTAGVGAVARGTPGSSGQQTEVQYLKPTERSGHDIAVTVNIDAGSPIHEILSRSHQISVQHAPDAAAAQITLKPADTLPNKDFVLRYKVAGATSSGALLTHRDAQSGQGYFALLLYPPAQLADIPRAPVEFVFVVDTSGSMSGEPIALAKRAMRAALHRMLPDDTFQVLNFSNDVSTLGPQPIAATPDNVKRGLAYVEQLQASGGTMMMKSITAALGYPAEPQRTRYVAFLTDGYVGNEPQILGEICKTLGASRMFSFGIGSSPNRYLLDGMAQYGHGAVAYVGLNDDAAAIMERFFDRVSHPALTDVKVADWGPAETVKGVGVVPANGTTVSDVYPFRVPDLFVGRPAVLVGRFTGQAPGALRPVRITGMVRGKPVELLVGGPTTAGAPQTGGNVILAAASGDPQPTNGNAAASANAVDMPGRRIAEASGRPALAAIWARYRIADFSARLLEKNDAELVSAIRQTALDHSLMSAYTAFIAVDSSQVTAGDHGTTVSVAVPVPEGVRYDTTVPE